MGERWVLGTKGVTMRRHPAQREPEMLLDELGILLNMELYE